MRKKINFYILLLVLPFFCSLNVVGADTTIVQSPDGAIFFKLFQQANQLSYSITFNGKNIIEASPLLMTVDGKSITKNVIVNKTERYKINNSFPWMGVHSTALNHCNGAKIVINRNGDALEIRVFKDAAAFRFIIPGRENINRIPDETTVFNIPSKSTIWYHDLYMHYESVHVKKQIDNVRDGEWVAPPATFKLPQGVYALW